MHFSIIAAAVIALVSALPQGPTPAPTPTPANVDETVLNFALTLEHLEATYYNSFLAAKNQKCFVTEGFGAARASIQTIANHENTHVAVLTSVINSVYGANQSVPACTYNFPRFTTVKAGIQFAAVLEKVGVSAYIGAFALLQNKDLLTAGASIATVEARHAATLDVLSKYVPFPNAFDTPLGIRAVVSLIAPLVKSCPFTLPGTPFNSTLALVQSSAMIGSTIKVAFSAPSSTGLQCNFQVGSQSVMTSVVVDAANYADGKVHGSCAVPTALKGNAASVVFIMSNNTVYAPLVERNVVAGPSFLDLTM